MRKFVSKKKGYLNSWWLWRWHMALRFTWFVSFDLYFFFKEKNKQLNKRLTFAGEMWGTVCWIGFGRLSVTGSLWQLATALLNLRDGARHIAYTRKKTCCTFPKTFLSVCHTYMRSPTLGMLTYTRTLPVGMPHRHENTFCRYAPHTPEHFLLICPTGARTLPLGMPHITRTLPVGMPHRHEKASSRYAPHTPEHCLSVCPTDTRTLSPICPRRRENKTTRKCGIF